MQTARRFAILLVAFCLFAANLIVPGNTLVSVCRMSGLPMAAAVANPAPVPVAHSACCAHKHSASHVSEISDASASIGSGSCCVVRSREKGSLPYSWTEQHSFAVAALAPVTEFHWNAPVADVSVARLVRDGRSFRGPPDRQTAPRAPPFFS